MALQEGGQIVRVEMNVVVGRLKTDRCASHEWIKIFPSSSSSSSPSSFFGGSTSSMSSMRRDMA